MRTTREHYSIRKLVQAWQSAELRMNPEYQRGAAWSLAQKQALIDSAFREYPLPPLFLEKKVTTGALGGGQTVKYEVVDGQQRLLAFHEFCSDRFHLLDSSDKRLRLPTSLRSSPSPWAKKKYSDLGGDLRRQLDEVLIDVYELHDVENSDQVRDLFIRLQSGTALTRQQIRDAWPGRVGPFIEHLAGKLSTTPACDLFRLIDRRGTRSEDDDLKDEYVGDRQTCAQLLRLFLAREREPRAAPGVAAGDLDALYHEYTDLDPDGESARQFRRCLDEASQVFALVAPAATLSTVRKRTKVRKIDAFATVMFFQDILRSPLFRIDFKERVRLAKQIGEFEKAIKPSGKGTSGQAIRDHYEKFRERATVGIGIELDPNRAFSDEQKAKLYEMANGICGVCLRPIEDGEAVEGDHFPIAWRDGGRTHIDNGRIVHARCHQRGRPATVPPDVS
jgi:hypothetical protein